MGDRGPRVLNALIKATEREGTAKDAIPIVMKASEALVQIGVTSPEVMAALNKVAERKDLDEQQKFTIARLIEEIKKPKEDVKRAEKAKEKPKGEIINKNNKRGGGR